MGFLPLTRANGAGWDRDRHRDTRMVEKCSGRLTVSCAGETIRRTAPSFGIVGDTKVMPIVA